MRLIPIALIAMASIIASGACSSHRPALARPQNANAPEALASDADRRCALVQAPLVVKRNGKAILQVWNVTAGDDFSSPTLPEDSAFMEYRSTIERAGAALRRPVADPPTPRDKRERQVWNREEENVELAYSGRLGDIRPIRCLDALLFAYQNARFSQITHPTEFVATILRKEVDGQTVYRLYFGASDSMFPPKDFYGFDEIEGDLRAGWKFWTFLHNHTVQTYNGKPALGVPAPSTSDVALLAHLVDTMGLENAWITNGFFTIEIPARALEFYVGRP